MNQDINSFPNKPLKRARKRLSESVKIRNRGKRMFQALKGERLDEFFTSGYSVITIGLRRAKRLHGEYSTMFSRKLMVLGAMMEKQRTVGRWSITDISRYFGSGYNDQAGPYFERLIAEGWAVPVAPDLKQRFAVCSPLFFQLVNDMTAILRRVDQERQARAKGYELPPPGHSLNPTVNRYFVEVEDLRRVPGK